MSGESAARDACWPAAAAYRSQHNADQLTSSYNASMDEEAGFKRAVSHYKQHDRSPSTWLRRGTLLAATVRLGINWLLKGTAWIVYQELGLWSSAMSVGTVPNQRSG